MSKLLVVGLALGVIANSAVWGTESKSIDAERQQLFARGFRVAAGKASITFSRSYGNLIVRGDKLIVRGPVERDFYDALKKALQENPGIKTVVLGSDGGNVVGAIRAGFMIRERGLDTEVSDHCLSACPLVFMGGVNRRMWTTASRLGFHQVSMQGKVVPPDDPIYKGIESYLILMNVDSGYVMRAMMSAGPAGMFIPEPAKLCGSRVTTFIRRIC